MTYSVSAGQPASNAIDATDVESQVNGNSRARVIGRLDRLAQQISLDRPDQPERLQESLDLFIDAWFHPVSRPACSVRAGWNRAEQSVELEGAVNWREQSDALDLFLHRLGYERVHNQLRVLPDERLGDQPVGVVTAVNTPMYDRPEKDSEMTNELLFGELMFLLDAATDGYGLCQCADGYVGYVKTCALERISCESAKKYRDNPQGVFVRDYLIDGRTLKRGTALPLHHVGETVVALETPAGEIIQVSPVDVAIRPSTASPRVNEMLKSALSHLGTPYRWGGVTARGIDCSGLTQRAFGSIGVYLPRDARDQAMIGRLTATRRDKAGLRAGDLMFFVNFAGLIDHVAISVGGDRFLEACDKGVVISSVDVNSPDYCRRGDQRFVFARRVCD